MFQLQLFFLLHCDEWDRVIALPRHKFVTGATLLQLVCGSTEYGFKVLSKPATSLDSQKSWVILLMNIHKPNRVMYDVSK